MESRRPDRPGDEGPFAVRGEIQALAMGSDSDGPLVVAWSPDGPERRFHQVRLSFLDSKTFDVLRADSLGYGRAFGRNGSIRGLSPSGGSLLIGFDRPQIRAAAGGHLYGIWWPNNSPTSFQTLAVQEATLEANYRTSPTSLSSPVRWAGRSSPAAGACAIAWAARSEAWSLARVGPHR